jgi:hypothetical protein
MIDIIFFLLGLLHDEQLYMAEQRALPVNLPRQPRAGRIWKKGCRHGIRRGRVMVDREEVPADLSGRPKS